MDHFLIINLISIIVNILFSIVLKYHTKWFWYNKKSKNFRKNDRKKFDLHQKRSELSTKVWYKKRKKHLSKESRPRRTIFGNSNPSFGPERGQGTRAAPCSKWCCVRPLSLFIPFFFAPASFLSLPLSVFPWDWSANPVIHRKHRMQTVTWVVGSRVLRGRARGKRRGEGGDRSAYVCVLWRQAVHCLYSCCFSSRCAEGGCGGFVISVPCVKTTVWLISNSENRVRHWN